MITSISQAENFNTDMNILSGQVQKNAKGCLDTFSDILGNLLPQLNEQQQTEQQQTEQQQTEQDMLLGENKSGSTKDIQEEAETDDQILSVANSMLTAFYPIIQQDSVSTKKCAVETVKSVDVQQCMQSCEQVTLEKSDLWVGNQDENTQAVNDTVHIEKSENFNLKDITEPIPQDFIQSKKFDLNGEVKSTEPQKAEVSFQSKVFEHNKSSIENLSTRQNNVVAENAGSTLQKAEKEMDCEISALKHRNSVPVQNVTLKKLGKKFIMPDENSTNDFNEKGILDGKTDRQGTDRKTVSLKDTQNSSASAFQMNVPEQISNKMESEIISDGIPKGNMLSQVTDKVIETVKNGQSDFKLKLSPKGLGQVSVTISCKNKKISLNIHANVPETGKLLESQMSDLKASLSAKNYELIGSEVNFDKDFSDGNQASMASMGYNTSAFSSKGFGSSAFSGFQGDSREWHQTRSGDYYSRQNTANNNTEFDYRKPLLDGRLNYIT